MERAPSRVETASTGSGSDVPLPEDLLTCPITFEPYQIANEEDGDDFVPIDPPCHHTLSKIALKDILAQPDPEKWRCPTCQEVLPSNDINHYKPNRFALGVLEAMDAARVRAEEVRLRAADDALDQQQREDAADAGAARPPLAEPAEVPLPEGWEQACVEFDVHELGGTLQRFQAKEDVVARHRNGLVSSGIISLNGRDARVAVKLVLPTDTAGNADVRGAARCEVAALAHVTRHVPAAVLGLKGFLDAGNFLIAQELPGVSLIKHLEKVINEQGGLRASAWLELMLQLIDCVRQLHGCNVIHCDISPASVTRSASGTLKLTDFSSARLCGPPDDGSTLLAAPVAAFPSRRVAYLAPEQLIQVVAKTRHNVAARGGAVEPAARVLTGTVTDRTDVWAFAVFALHLWTGSPPTRGVTPDYAASTLPDLLRDLFMGCLSSSPAKRPSATEVYDNLCLVAEIKDSIPQFAAETEICVGVPGGAAPVPRLSVASTSRTSYGSAPPPPSSSRAAAAPVSAVPPAAPAPVGPAPAAPPAAAAPGAEAAAAEPAPALSAFDDAKRRLREEQERQAEEKARRPAEAVRRGKLGRAFRQILKAAS